MAAKLSSCFLSHGLSGLNRNEQVNVRFRVPPPRILPASCKMRHRNVSSQHKRQQVKKGPPERTPTNTNFQSNGAENSESENALTDSISTLDQESISDDDVDTSIAVEHNYDKDLNSSTCIGGDKIFGILL
ncbi:hypothetical protein L1049_009754 [Liquidambar formosana]|uniref:Uncharacterized protein n=1 Tax=Liquidambar formosana TaxID=63359 RepID=A0AAP0R3P5_LIQFO